jgi:hypothetical protein
MTMLRMTSLAAVCLTLSACDRYMMDKYMVREDTATFASGDAVAWNSAVQVPNPWPRYSNDTNIAFDADRNSLAIRRYKKDKEFLGYSWLGERQEIGPGAETGAGPSGGAGSAMGGGGAPPVGPGY